MDFATEHSHIGKHMTGKGLKHKNENRFCGTVDENPEHVIFIGIAEIRVSQFSKALKDEEEIPSLK